MTDAALRDGLYAVPIILGSALSLAACFVIFYTFRSFEDLRRHPNGLVLMRSVFDCVFAISAIVESSMRLGGLTGKPGLDTCQAFSFFNQIAIPGSELSFLMLSYDLYVALRNPFVDYKSSMRKYITYTSIGSTVMAAILIGTNDTVYGMTNFGLCWVRVEDTANRYMWAFFYWIVIVTYAWSMFVLVYARRRLVKGLRETYEARMTTFRHGMTFLIGYSVFWTIVAIVYWASMPTSRPPGIHAAAWIFCLVFCSRGVATMGVWMYNHNLREVARDEAARARGGSKLGKVNRQLQPSLNLALRKEILHYTTLAIRLSVVQTVGEEAVGNMLRAMKSQLARRARAMGSNPNNTESKSGPAMTAFEAAAAATAAQSMYQMPTALKSPTSPNLGPRSPTVGSTVNPAAAAIAAAAHNATVKSAALGGGFHDLDMIITQAGRLTPFNDRLRTVADSSLSVEWKPLNIALYAPMFERGGLYDLGEFTTSSSTAKDGKRGSIAPEPARKSSIGHVSQGARSAEDAHKGGDAVPEHGLTPTSVDDSTGLIRRPPLELHDLAPDIFARIRDLSGISPAQFLFSLSRTTKERFSEGASGAFMCFSHDMRFVIKTMEKDEADVLQRILPAYLEHIRSNEDTLIIKFYACMSLRLYRQTMYFVVMENIFPTRATIHERFDLKGSWVGRSAGKGVPGTVAYCRYCNERFRVGSSEMCSAKPNRPHVVNTVLKDNDLTFKLRLAPEKAATLGAQLRSDAEFLSRMGVMDYSLLIGVHNRKFRIENDLLAPGASAPGAGASQAAAAANARWAAALQNAAPAALPPTSPPAASRTAPRTPSLPANSRRSLATGVRFAAEVSELPEDPDTPVTSTRSAKGVSFSFPAGEALPPPALGNASTGRVGNVSPRAHSDTLDSIDYDDDELHPPASAASHVPFFRQDEGGMSSAIIEGPGVFYMGIIDILQEWSLIKRMERWLKGYFMCMDIHGISVVPPDEYAARFEQRVISEIIERDTPGVTGSIPASRRMSLAPKALTTQRSILPPVSASWSAGQYQQHAPFFSVANPQRAMGAGPGAAPTTARPPAPAAAVRAPATPARTPNAMHRPSLSGAEMVAAHALGINISGRTSPKSGGVRIR